MLVGLNIQIFLHDVKDVLQTVAMLMGLLYTQNTDYPKEPLYSFEAKQNFLINIGVDHCFSML